MLKDFKAFIMRGNVMDLAVAVIIGAAFGKIVSSLVADIIMPVIGLISGGIDFSGLQVKIGGTEAEPVYLTYGMFIQAAIDFLIIAAVIFFMIRLLSKLQKPKEVEVSTKSCRFCISEIPLQATRCPSCTSQLE
ncbi:MAG: large conductance mechanosensitive channel protein MscL [Candidatus Nomurabacteria bacterium]|nr:MAG: large conductance mechanosensitive channel protein MscL [Candidatus Nomurabacteria bacterium]